MKPDKRMKEESCAINYELYVQLYVVCTAGSYRSEWSRDCGLDWSVYCQAAAPEETKQTNMELIKSVSERRRSGSTLPCHLHYLCWLFEYPALWGRHVLPGATFSLEASRCQAANFSSCGCVCTQQLFTWLNLTHPNQKLLLLKCLEGRGKLIGTDWRSALTDDAWSLFCWSCWM